MIGPPKSFTFPAFAFGAALCLFLTGGCSTTPVVRNGEIITPQAVVGFPCAGVVVAFSREPDRLATVCENGTLVLLTPEGRVVTETAKSFLLETSGLGGAGENLEAFGFRGGNEHGRNPELNAHNVYRGGKRPIPLPNDYSDHRSEYIAIEDQGDCLVIARRIQPNVSQYQLAAFPRVSPSEQPVVFGQQPTLIAEGDGHLVSGLGRVNGSLARCVGGGTNPALVLIHRFRAADRSILYQVVVHNVSGKRVVHEQAATFLKIVNRVKDTQIALIDDATGRLAVLDAANGVFEWSKNREGRKWIDYDLTTGKGVAVQKLTDAYALLAIDCDGDPSSVCRERIIEPSVSRDAYSLMASPPGGGFIVNFERRRSPQDEDSLGRFTRWIY